MPTPNQVLPWQESLNSWRLKGFDVLLRILFDLIFVLIQFYSLIWISAYDPENPWKLDFSKDTNVKGAISAICGVLAACVLMPICELVQIAIRRSGGENISLRENMLILWAFTRTPAPVIPKNESVVVQAPKKHGKAHEATWHVRMIRFRKHIYESTNHNAYKIPLLFLITAWATLGLVESGYWWRVEDEELTPNQSLVLWDKSAMPMWLWYADLFFLGTILVYFLVIEMTEKSLRKIVTRSSFWVNQANMPIITILGAICMRYITGLTKYNFIHIFYPIRWIGVGMLMTKFLAKEQALDLLGGNEVRVALTQALVKIMCMVLTFTFLFFIFEYKPLSDAAFLGSVLDAENDPPEAGDYHFGAFTCFYYILVTISTVGYGDYYPVSYFGRFIVMGFIVAALMSIPNMLNDLSEAKQHSIVHGTLPPFRRMKDTVVIFGPINGDTFVRLLNGIEASNSMTHRCDVEYVMAIIPRHKHDDILQAIEGKEFSINICIIKGDVAFGCTDMDKVLRRIKIDRWQYVRQIIIISDFQDTGDVTREARMTLSRVEAVRKQLSNKLRLGSNHYISAATFNTHEERMIMGAVDGRGMVLSRYKGALLAESTLTFGLSSLLLPLFALDSHPPMQYKVCTDIIDWQRRGLSFFIRYISCPRVLIDTPMDIVVRLVYTFFNSVVIGYKNKKGNILLGCNFNIMQQRLSLYDSLIVVTSLTDIDIMSTTFAGNHGKSLRMHADSLAAARTGNKTMSSSTDSSSVQSVSPKGLPRTMATMAPAPRATREINIVADLEESPFAFSDRKLVLVLGVGAGVEQIINRLCEYDINVLWLMSCPYPKEVYKHISGDLENLCVMENRDCDTQTLMDAGLTQCNCVVLLPRCLLDEEEEEGEDIVDTHLYATYLRVRDVVSRIDNTDRPSIIYNLECPENIRFFDSIDQSVFRNYEGTDSYALMSSPEFLSGRAFIDANLDHLLYNNYRINPVCSDFIILARLLGVDDNTDSSTVCAQREQVSLMPARDDSRTYQEMFNYLLDRSCIALGVLRWNDDGNTHVVINPSSDFLLSVKDRIYYLKCSQT